MVELSNVLTGGQKSFCKSTTMRADMITKKMTDRSETRCESEMKSRRAKMKKLDKYSGDGSGEDDSKDEDES